MLLSYSGALAVSVGQLTANWDSATSPVQALQAEAPDQNQQLYVGIEGVWQLKAKVTQAESFATSADTRIRDRGGKNDELRGLTETLTRTVAEIVLT